jgi:hypothetical protein
MDSMIGTDGHGLKVADPLSQVGKALPLVGVSTPLVRMPMLAHSLQ